MGLDALHSSMKDVEKALQDQLERREKLLKESRDVISSCSRAIISIHGGDSRAASREIARAKGQLDALRKAGEGQLSRYLVSPETEFVEASAVFALASGKDVPSRSSLSASPEAYLLGLLDSVGELKRLVLDSVMKGRLPTAKRYFAEMEMLYSICSPMAAYDHVAGGARRKIDVARMLVEDTRGLLAEESGRAAVTASMEKLSKKLKARA
jgi:translin